MTKIFNNSWLTLMSVCSFLMLASVSFESQSQTTATIADKSNNIQVAWRDGYYRNGYWHHRYYRPHWQPYYRYGVGCYKRCVVRHHNVYCRRWCR